MTPRWYRFGLLALLLLHAGMVAVLTRTTACTTDELIYLRVGQGIREHLSWDLEQAKFHGPLPFLANQLFAGWAVPLEPLRDYLPWGRLGMLPFALVGAAALARLGRLAFGPAAGLAALALHVLNPVVLANAPLVTPDTALASAYLVTIAVAWGYLRAPRTAKLLALGVALGVSLATKYLAIFLVPVLAIAALGATLRGFRPALLWSRSRSTLDARAVDVAIAAVVIAAIALLTLWTCYLWAVPRWSPGTTRSHSLGTVLGAPLVESLLTLLPAPFVDGIDFQKMQGEIRPTAFLDQYRFAGHPAYYVTAIALKLPLVTLALVALGLVWRRPRWPARLPLLIATAVAVPMLALSCLSSLQLGIRYVLFVLPLLCLIAGRAAAALAHHRGVVAVAALLLIGANARAWPHYGSAFNVLAGDRPYLWFVDNTLSWAYTAAPDDLAELRRRHPGAVEVYGSDGPRFGKVVMHGSWFAAVDARDPARLYHWLRRFHPVDRLDAQFVFDVDEASFRAALAADGEQDRGRGRVELAVALTFAGAARAALAELDGVDDPDAAQARRIAAIATRDPDAPELLSLALAVGRADVVRAAGDRAPTTLRAVALTAAYDADAVVRLLTTAQQSRALTQQEALLLANAHHLRHDDANALAVLERYPPSAEAPEHAVYEQLRTTLRARLDYEQRMRQRGLVPHTR